MTTKERSRPDGLPAYSVLALSIIASLLAQFLGGSLPAAAHDDASYFVAKWGDQDWIIGNTLGGDLEFPEASTAMQLADDPWNSVVGSGFDFVFEGTDANKVYVGDPCDQSIPGVNVAVYGVGLSGLGFTELCYSSGQIFEATIALDETSRLCDGTNPICSSCYDLRGALTHEFGHAMGEWTPALGGHWSGSELCPGNSTDHTMCGNYWTGTNHFQTLGSQDTHTAANAY